MKVVEFALTAAVTTLLLLALVTVASSQELEDYVDKEAISEAIDDYKGKVHTHLMAVHLSSPQCWRLGGNENALF